MFCGLLLDGSTPCMANKSATGTVVFREYVRHFPTPVLRPDNVVVMDNPTPHKRAETLALIARAKAEALFLPAYSPDLNPIEKTWRKLKPVAGQRGAHAGRVAARH